VLRFYAYWIAPLTAAGYRGECAVRQNGGLSVGVFG
jgi:hypothetical protein